MGQHSDAHHAGVVFVAALILVVAAIYLLVTKTIHEEHIERTTGPKGINFAEGCTCVDSNKFFGEGYRT